MIVDIHKPDTSTLVTTGHFYFGWTNSPARIANLAALGLNSPGIKFDFDEVPPQLESREISICVVSRVMPSEIHARK